LAILPTGVILRVIYLIMFTTVTKPTLRVLPRAKNRPCRIL